MKRTANMYGEPITIKDLQSFIGSVIVIDEIKKIITGFNDKNFYVEKDGLKDKISISKLLYFGLVPGGADSGPKWIINWEYRVGYPKELKW